MKPLAILGGTFDPFHCGHLYLAQAAINFFQCRLRIIPNGSPPHRPAPVATWHHRLMMCRQATAGCPDIDIGEEENPSQVCYTAHTLMTLKKKHPHNTLLLIIGSDAYTSWESWHQPETILKLAHLIVAHRPQTKKVALDWGVPMTDKTTLSKGCGGVYLWRCQPPAVSSTNCRKRLGKKQSVNCDLPPAVISYIREQRLYQDK